MRILDFIRGVDKEVSSNAQRHFEAELRKIHPDLEIVDLKRKKG